MYPDADKLQQIVKNANKIVVVQADNPDGDSIGSALALEEILGNLGKETALYCAVDMPGYLRYMPGWDRVAGELPKQFDASIIVDASTMTLFERLASSGEQGWLASKPCIVLDHHETVENIIPFADVMINDHTSASTGELIYKLSKQLGWEVSKTAGEYLMTSILGDTQGLTNDLAGSDTYRIMAEFIELGVSRPKLEELRREYGKMPVEIYRYKADLIKRTEFKADGALALASIPQHEINTYSPLYNPAPLIQNDMLQTKGVRVAIVFKQYDDGRITGAIRSNQGAPIAARIAEKLGGGGHPYASGFKIVSGKTLEQVKTTAIESATEFLATL
jgi:phosphoesterase RecJ-like protein